MSSLIFYTDETQALVATDTLVADADSGLPSFFCSKAIFVPHLGVIIASTGLASFADHWFECVNSYEDVWDVDSVAEAAAIQLPNLLDGYYQQFPFVLERARNKATVTVYHFGFSSKDSRIKAFAHRSEHNFTPELIEYGTATKPPCEITHTEYELIKIIPDLMKKQRIEQESMPRQDRVYIGGEIFAWYLCKDECRSFKLGQFEDYNEHTSIVDAKLTER